MMIGIGLWLTLYLIKMRQKRDVQLIKSFVIVAAIPAGLLGFLFLSRLMAYVPYHKKWYSIFTVADIDTFKSILTHSNILCFPKWGALES